MHKVIKVFRDKNTKQVYAIGDNFTSDDQDRVDDLLKRKLIEGVSNNDTPPVDYESMTKDGLAELLIQRGIEFNKKQTKPELIELLQGGELDVTE